MISNSASLAEWLDRLERGHPKAIDLGLDRCQQVFQNLGSPRPGARVITVAGTNGKGSAIAWLKALLTALGFSTAAYTSPHLLRFNERLDINGALVTDHDLVAAFEEVEAARGGVTLTYFEFSTLACLLLMNRAAPDFALLEVGLGGRLDTVNLVDADLVMIMPIGLDHQEYLGAGRDSIGAEKAGVMRPGKPVVCGEPTPPDSVLRQAGKMNCPVYLPGRDYRYRFAEHGLVFAMGQEEWTLPKLPLRGAYQSANLAAALAALTVMCPRAGTRREALRRGVKQVCLPGRLQHVPEDPRLVVDVGHNPLAAEAVAAHLMAEGRAPCHCVLGMLADKDAEGVARALGTVIAYWHCASLAGARGQTGDALAQRVTTAGEGAGISTYDSVAKALRSARAAVGDSGTILVFGSFQTAAAALRVLGSADY